MPRSDRRRHPIRAGRGRAARLGVRRRRLRPGLRAGRRHARELPARRLVLQFSTVIGTYLFAMGVGSWLSRYVERQLVAQFVRIELLVGLIGGLMPAALFALQSAGDAVVPLRALCAGARRRRPGRARDPAGDAHPEAPRRDERAAAPKELVSQVLTFDYLGALVRLGRLPAAARAAPRADPHRRSSSACSTPAVAVWALWLFRGELRARRRAALGLRAVIIAALVAALRRRRPRHDLGRRPLLRRPRASTRDHALPAHRRHRSAGRRAAVPQRQPAVPLARRVPLSRGAGASGDGGAPARRGACWCSAAATGWRCARSCKYPSVEQVTLVELDPHMTRLFSTQPLLRG